MKCKSIRQPPRGVDKGGRLLEPGGRAFSLEEACDRIAT